MRLKAPNSSVTLSCLFVVLSVCASLPRASLCQTSWPDLERVLKGARAARAKYVETFKNITADETKVTEVFDERGALKKRRALLASFLVYQSQADGETPLEFHVIREVDGEPVSNYVGRTEDLFTKIAGANNWRDEWKRIHRENTRYRLKYERWGVTIYAGAVVEEKAAEHFDYEASAGEKVGGRATVVLSYRAKGLSTQPASSMKPESKTTYLGERGRLWLDAETFQLLRWENEKIARHGKTGERYVFVRDHADFSASDLGINVPRRIVTDFLTHDFDPKSRRPSTERVEGRITFTYDAFKRFDVTSREQLDPVSPLTIPPHL